LYKRNCYLCNKSVIGIYKDGIPVCCSECWNGGKLDLLSYGVEYDFSRPFFEQWFVLLKKVPKLFAYKIGTLINSDYTNYSLNNKNVYLSYSVIECEDTMYSESVDKSKNIFDCCPFSFYCFHYFPHQPGNNKSPDAISNIYSCCINASYNYF